MKRRSRNVRILGAAVALLVVVVVTIRVVAAVTSDDPIERSYLIVRDESIGGFPRNGTVGMVAETLGQPAAKIGRFDGCSLRWPDRGIVMEAIFTNPGNKCQAKARHVSTTVTDARWETDAGLKIGDPEARLRELYPDAPPADSDGVIELFTREVSGLPLPSLTAKVAGGRVVAFTLHGPPHTF